MTFGEFVIKYVGYIIKQMTQGMRETFIQPSPFLPCQVYKHDNTKLSEWPYSQEGEEGEEGKGTS